MDYCRQLNPATGDVVFDTARGSWALGHPATEIIVRCLRTPIGTAQRDPTYGIDLDGVASNVLGVRALVETRIRLALSRWVKAGTFTIDSIQVDIAGSAILVVVNFRDPRDLIAGAIATPPVRLAA